MSVRQLTVGCLIDGHSFCQLLCDGDTVGHAEVQGLFKPLALNQQLYCLLKLPMLERVKQASQNQYQSIKSIHQSDPWIWSINQSIYLSVNQPNQSDWLIDRSINQSINRSINQSINQFISRSTKSTNQPIIDQNQQNRHCVCKLRSVHLLKVLCHLVCHLRAGLLTQVLSYLVESIKVTVLETQLQCLWNLACLRGEREREERMAGGRVERVVREGGGRNAASNGALKAYNSLLMWKCTNLVVQHDRFV